MPPQDKHKAHVGSAGSPRQRYGWYRDYLVNALDEAGCSCAEYTSDLHPCLVCEARRFIEAADVIANG